VKRVYLTLRVNKTSTKQKVKSIKKDAVTPKYVSTNQLTMSGFEIPFAQALTSENRRLQPFKQIPCDKVVGKL
jgi:hypothetical protein